MYLYCNVKLNTIIMFVIFAFTQNCFCDEAPVDAKHLPSPKISNKMLHGIQKIHSFLKQECFTTFFSSNDPFNMPHDFLSATVVLRQIITQNSAIARRGDITQRRNCCELYLVVIQTIHESIDTQFDSADVAKSNIGPDATKSNVELGDIWQIYFCGMSPESIHNSQIRNEYKMALDKNKRHTYDIYEQVSLKELLVYSQKSFHHFVCKSYSIEFQNDAELVELFEKYNYPKEERIKILCELKIPYKGFRNWQSTDKLFKTNAKFISLDKDEVTLEKSDGKRTTIEYSVLRKEDQDYVKEQLNPEIKTPKNETMKD